MPASPRRRPAPFVVLLFCAAVGLLAGMVAAAVTPAPWTATAKVFVGAQSTTIVDPGRSEAVTEQIRDSYRQVATAPLVLEPVIRELGLDVSVAELGRSVDVEAPAGTAVLEITAADADRARAVAVANAVARELAASSSALTPSTQVVAVEQHVTVIARASAADARVAAAPLATVLVGLLAGSGVGAGVLTLVALRDRRPPSGGLAAPSML